MTKNMFEVKDGYIDMEGMQKKADEANDQKLKESQDRWKKQQEAYIKQRDKHQELFNKAILKSKEEREQLAMNTIEQEKEQAAMELEKEFEARGIKTDSVKKRDDLYRSLLKGL